MVYSKFLGLLLILVVIKACIFITLARRKVCKLLLDLRNRLCFKHNTINQKTRKNFMNSFLWPNYFINPSIL